MKPRYLLTRWHYWCRQVLLGYRTIPHGMDRQSLWTEKAVWTLETESCHDSNVVVVGCTGVVMMMWRIKGNIDCRMSFRDMISPDDLTIPVAPLTFGLTLIPDWISNYIYHILRYEIIQQFPNFSGGTVEVWELMNNFISPFTGHMLTYPCRL